ncbi:MAG TPA: hypothetical protein VIK06_02020 [Candidatus Limnocylindrales bacterium]
MIGAPLADSLELSKRQFGFVQPVLARPEEAGAEGGSPVHVLDAANERELLELAGALAMSSGP